MLELKKDNFSIKHYKLSEDRKILAVADNNIILIWDLIKKCLFREITLKDNIINNLLITKDNTHLQFFSGKNTKIIGQLLKFRAWNLVNNSYETKRKLFISNEYNNIKFKGNYKEMGDNKAVVCLDDPPHCCFLHWVDESGCEILSVANPVIVSLETERLVTYWKNARGTKGIKDISNNYQSRLFRKYINNESICIIDIISMEIEGFLPSKATLIPEKFIDNGKCALFLTKKNTIQIWNIINYICLFEFSQYQHLDHISLSSDMHFIACLTSGSEFITLQNIENRKEIYKVCKYPGKSLAYFYIEKLNKAVIAHEDMTVRLWNLTTLENYVLVQFFNKNYNNLAIFNEKYVCVGTLLGYICVFDVEFMAKVFEVKYERVCSFVMSFDNKWLIYAGKNISIWNLEKCIEVKKFKGNGNEIVSLGLSKNLRLLVSGSIYRIYYIWRINRNIVEIGHKKKFHIIYLLSLV